MKENGRPARPTNKKSSQRLLFCSSRRKSALCDLGLRANCAEFLAEFLNAASGVDDFVLAGVERVRFSRHLDLDQRVFLTFVFNFFAGLDGRTGDEFEIARQVVENNFAVFWMGIELHGMPRLVW